MADYFTNFSFIVQLTNPEQQTQALQLFQQMSAIQQGEEGPKDFAASLREFADDCVFEVEAQESDKLWIHSDCGGVDSVCEFVHYIIKKFALQPVAFEWSFDCNKPRTDAFGGGAAFISSAEIKSITTFQWIREQTQSLQPKT